MKKLISIALLITMLAAMLAVNVLAVDGGDNYGNVPQAKGVAITIDGKKDAIYDQALKIDVKRDPTSKTDSTAVGYLVWDTGFLYVFVEVKDTQMVKVDTALQPTSPWMVDSMEVFVQPGNDGVLVGQYRVDPTGYLSHQTQKTKVTDINLKGADVKATHFEGAAGELAGGYTTEFKIPMTQVAGAKLGFNFQINDIRNDASRVVVYSASKLGATSWDGDKYDYITLGSNAIALPTAATTTKAAASGGTTAPKTGDNTIAIVAILVLAVCSGAVVVRAKNRAK